MIVCLDTAQLSEGGIFNCTVIGTAQRAKKTWLPSFLLCDIELTQALMYHPKAGFTKSHLMRPPDRTEEE